jgi:hypothetical protein
VPKPLRLVLLLALFVLPQIPPLLDEKATTLRQFIRQAYTLNTFISNTSANWTFCGLLKKISRPRIFDIRKNTSKFKKAAIFDQTSVQV